MIKPSDQINSNSVFTIARLAFMMLLQFIVWGAWYVSMTGFINAQNMTALTGACYTIGPLAAIIAPFFLSMVADRFFATERVLGVLHIVGGGFLMLAPAMASEFTLPAAPEGSSLFYKIFVHDISAYGQPFVICLFLHMLCYMPTLGLTASLSFKNLDSPEKQFPIVRVLGTIGWIVGNLVISLFALKDASSMQFYFAGGVGILLGLYCFTLPHTPPSKEQKTTIAQVLGLDSLVLLKQPSYAVFILCSFLLCIPLAGYYAEARNFVDFANATVFESATFTMSFGQMSEIFFMLVMPLFFARLGVKYMLAVGMLAWVARYALFALAAPSSTVWMIMIGIVLHGICYDFFFVTGMIYADKKASKEVRNQAQGFLVLITQGLGLGLGAKLFFAHKQMNTDGDVVDWQTVWMYPSIFAGVVLVIFLALFWDNVDSDNK